MGEVTQLHPADTDLIDPADAALRPWSLQRRALFVLSAGAVSWGALLWLAWELARLV